MKTLSLPFFQVDAFAERPLTGNPAAICPLETWLPDATLQSIAAENNLSETAFFVPVAGTDRYHLRWFTPTVEVSLCGHATLASAWVVLEKLAPSRDEVVFDSQSGPLRVTKTDDGRPGAPLLTLDFPELPLAAGEVSPALVAALGRSPRAVLAGRDTVALFDDAATVRALAPDWAALRALPTHGICVTAPGTGADADVDFVSRFFAPAAGVDEDPVTGSTHTYLTRLWGERLDKNRLRARQVSRRGGELTVVLAPPRVQITGRAVLVIEGRFHLG